MGRVVKNRPRRLHMLIYYIAFGVILHLLYSKLIHSSVNSSIDPFEYSLKNRQLENTAGFFFSDAFAKDAASNLTKWRSSIFLRTMQLYKEVEKETFSQTEPQGTRRWDLFSPIIKCPDNKQLTKYGGRGNGGKSLCPSVFLPGCVVYSLGSRNNFKFEEDILNKTPCEVVSFDCTSQAHEINARHKFVPKCLGTSERMKALPKTWVTLEGAMQELGHSKLALLKIDIEGFEYDVFSSWHLDALSLPEQISMEVHYRGVYWGTKSFNNTKDFSNLLWPGHEPSLSDLALFISHLANMGYAIVSREDNPNHSHCSELTLLRVSYTIARIGH